jgi:hypothetical protein
MSTEAAALGAYPRWLAGLKPLLLLAGVAVAVAAGVLVVLWSRGPTYTPLFANLGAEDQTQVAQALDAAGIPYQLEPGTNAIAVASEHVNDARLKARRPRPAAGRWRLRRHVEGSGLRLEPVHGERALPARPRI